MREEQATEKLEKIITEYLKSNKEIFEYIVNLVIVPWQFNYRALIFKQYFIRSLLLNYKYS